MKTLGIFGTWRASPGSALYQQAYLLGRAAAETEFVLVTGGYSGVMEAASRGAYDTGGVAIGITCPELDAQLRPNSYLKEVIQESDLAQRTARCIAMSDKMVFFPGRTGTAAELTVALDLVSKGLKQSPLILWGPFWEPLLNALSQSNSNLEWPFDDANLKDFYTVAYGVSEALSCPTTLGFDRPGSEAR